MRIAVLADIHGNARALEAVLIDMRAHAPDLVVNLGEHVSGPLQAAETADILVSQRDWLQILGNHDRRIIQQDSSEMRFSDKVAAEQLRDRHKAWLGELPATAMALEMFCSVTAHRSAMSNTCWKTFLSRA